MSDLHSEAPLLLRLTRPKGPEPWAAEAGESARICIAAGAAGPVGGDQLTVEVHVGAESTLVLSDISATLLLPGPDGEQSITRTRVTVEDGGTFVWTPEPVIAASGSDHVNDISIDLAENARAFVRDELLLGRHAEDPGTLHQRFHVSYAGTALYRQDLDLGQLAPPWRSPAVTDAHRAIGSVLIADPELERDGLPGRPLSERVAILPLAGPGVLITAVVPDTLTLRRELDAALEALGPPWTPMMPRAGAARTAASAR